MYYLLSTPIDGTQCFNSLQKLLYMTKRKKNPCGICQQSTRSIHQQQRTQPNEEIIHYHKATNKQISPNLHQAVKSKNKRDQSSWIPDSLPSAVMIKQHHRGRARQTERLDSRNHKLESMRSLHQSSLTTGGQKYLKITFIQEYRICCTILNQMEEIPGQTDRHINKSVNLKAYRPNWRLNSDLWPQQNKEEENTKSKASVTDCGVVSWSNVSHTSCDPDTLHNFPVFSGMNMTCHIVGPAWNTQGYLFHQSPSIWPRYLSASEMTNNLSHCGFLDPAVPRLTFTDTMKDRQLQALGIT